MGKSDLKIKVSAEISGVKLTEDCQLDDNISNMILDKMRKENLLFKNAVESFFGVFQVIWK
jgi:hypothetical protein